MGGNAFKTLHCPRIPADVYTKVKMITTNALATVFTYITIPFETPGKSDFGDVDFLVSAPFGDCTTLSLTTFPFPTVIEAIKHALDTSHGRRGFLTPDCMYFAIPMPTAPNTSAEDDKNSGEELASWIQVDVKICFQPELFSWMTFALNYASQSGLLGSMVKPVGLTLDPEGLHVRVQETEDTDWAGSRVWITRDPWTVCRVLGLGRRGVDGGFESSEEIYREYAASWLFHPGHFKAKLEEESYLVQHSHRSHFLKKWIPQRYPNFELDAEHPGDENLSAWTARTRTAVREKVFTMFPHAAAEYYTKRAEYTNNVEERRLRELVTNAIPSGTAGWSNHLPLPHMLIRQPDPDALHVQSMTGDFTPPPSPMHKPTAPNTPSSSSSSLSPPCVTSPPEPPLCIDALSRAPPHPCQPTPPPPSMSASARLSCLARWTSFSPTGAPYLLCSPHPKDFNLQWRDTVASGFGEEALVQWARDVWWCVWVRQCVVNWRGMWARRFEREDARARKVGVQVVKDGAQPEVRGVAEELAKKDREKVLGRLEALNRVLGLVGVEK